MQATLIESTITTQFPESSEGQQVSCFRRWAEAIRFSSRSAKVVSRFLESVENATQRDEVHNLLLRAAQELTGAIRVEIRPVGGPRRVLTSRSLFGNASAEPTAFTINYRDGLLGTLLLSPRRGRRLTPSMIAHLETLCSIAAIGDRLLGRERQLKVSLTANHEPLPRPNPLLLKFLRQLVLLSRRRKEPLSVLAIGLQPGNPPKAMAQGSSAIDLIDPVAAAVMATLRESDLVVQNDDETLIAVLPNASMVNTSLVAESVARAILDVLGWSELPLLAIGAACYPDDAQEADVLLDVAIEALRRSREDGIGQIVIADRDAFVPRFFEDSRVSVAI